MSKFNYSSELCDQVEQLDEKLAEVITLMKSIEKRVAKLEKIAHSKGLLSNAKNTVVTNQEDACCIV
jgi:hypothetical protein